jgi:hypothetical protein
MDEVHEHVRRQDSRDFALRSTAVVTQPRLGTVRWTVTECTPLQSFTGAILPGTALGRSRMLVRPHDRGIEGVPGWAAAPMLTSSIALIGAVLGSSGMSRTTSITAGTPPS